MENGLELSGIHRRRRNSGNQPSNSQQKSGRTASEVEDKKTSTTSKAHNKDQPHKSKEARRRQSWSNRGNKAKLRQEGGGNTRASMYLL
ncbi:hypothetical protein ACFX11_020912 [Malus domestica]